MSAWRETQINSTKIRNKSRLSTLSISTHIVLEVLVRAMRQLKEIKGIQIGKEEVKILFLGNAIVYINDLKYSNGTLLQLIITFGKVVGIQN